MDIGKEVEKELGFGCYCKRNEKLGFKHHNPCGYCRIVEIRKRKLNGGNTHYGN